METSTRRCGARLPGLTTSSTSKGTSGPARRCDTRVKMMWDDENIYFRGGVGRAARVGDPHRARLGDFHDNDFEVFLYPGFSTRTRPMQPYGTITSLRSTH